jgi:hypothetical protein
LGKKKAPAQLIIRSLRSAFVSGGSRRSRWTAFAEIAELTRYRERLEQRQSSSSDDVRDWYDMVRLRILSTIAATSPHGYRVADARFLAGAIHFEQGDTSEAVRWWPDIRPDSRDRYVDEYSRLLDELQWPERIRPRQIKYILDSVNSRWRTFSLERLRHFGLTCESY